MEKTAPPFAVRYGNLDTLPAILETQYILGVIGFGARPDFLPGDFPYLAAPLTPISGASMFEVWTAAKPVNPAEAGSVTGCSNDEIAFGMAILQEGQGIEAAAERAYLDIFDFLEKTGRKTPIRFWNYPVDITGDDAGMERYRRFNVGRQRAFSARLKQALPPAASAVGGHDGNSVIYFLAAPEPAIPVENPRQVSAYDYPAIYGPRSPSFSRASVYTQHGQSCLFVSGTASIVGHETLHEGDPVAQIVETAENLRAIIREAGQIVTAPMQGEWALKIYLHDTTIRHLVQPVAEAIFGADAPRLYLRADICRSELLLEIEAFRQF